MSGSAGVFGGPRGTGIPIPAVNQVFTNKYDDANPYAKRDFPDQETVREHRTAFERLMGVQEVDPPWFLGLAPGRYEGYGASDHPSKRPIWRLSQGGEFVAPSDSLLAALAAVEGLSPDDASGLAVGSVFCSHWVGLRGGAVSQLVLVNEGKGAGPAAGSGGRAVCLDAETVGEMLALDATDEKRLVWLAEIRKQLTKPW